MNNFQELEAIILSALRHPETGQPVTRAAADLRQLLQAQGLDKRETINVLNHLLATQQIERARVVEPGGLFYGAFRLVTPTLSHRRPTTPPRP